MVGGVCGPDGDGDWTPIDAAVAWDWAASTDGETRAAGAQALAATVAVASSDISRELHTSTVCTPLRGTPFRFQRNVGTVRIMRAALATATR